MMNQMATKVEIREHIEEIIERYIPQFKQHELEPINSWTKFNLDEILRQMNKEFIGYYYPVAMILTWDYDIVKINWSRESIRFLESIGWVAQR